jgi:hypothetical protein
MSNMGLSEKYGLAAALALLLVVLVDNAVVMLIVSVTGLAAGALVVRSGDARRVALVAAIAFAIVFGFAIYNLLR